MEQYTEQQQWLKRECEKLGVSNVVALETAPCGQNAFKLDPDRPYIWRELSPGAASGQAAGAHALLRRFAGSSAIGDTLPQLFERLGVRVEQAA